MNILVCIKQVPETNKVNVDPVTGVLNRDGIASKMNPYDLYALETALRIREAGEGTVTVLTMGPPQAELVIREAFAMGADHGVLLSDRKFGGADVLATSYTISQGIRRAGDYDLILCGKQTTDGDTAQVGPEVAEYLGIPSISNVTAITSITEEDLTVYMDMQEDMEIVRVKIPCLLSVDQGITQPRLPSYIRKKETEKQEIRILAFADMDDQNEGHYGLTGSPTQVCRIFPPDVNSDRELWTGDGRELTERLFMKLDELKFLS